VSREVAREDRRAGSATLAVVMAVAAVFAVGQGLSYPLLAFILDARGVSPTLIGLNTAMTPLGLLLSAPLLPRLAARFGAARLAFGCALLLALLLALIGAFQSLWVWFPARFVLGFAINGLFVPGETWVNALAPPQKRGRTVGVFASIISLGFATGPFVLIATGTQGPAPFLVGIGIALAVAAALFAVGPRLPGLGEGSASMWAFLPLAPFLLACIFVVAAYEQAALSLLPVYGLAKGLSQETMAAAVGALTLGSIVLQVPIGWLADAWSRRGVTVLLAALSVAGAALLPLAIQAGLLFWVFLVVWGSVTYAVYTLALVELGDRFRGGWLLAGNAAYAAMWGLGGAVGPAATGAAMDAAGPEGLPLAFGLLYAGLLVAALLRPRVTAPASA